MALDAGIKHRQKVSISLLPCYDVICITEQALNVFKILQVKDIASELVNLLQLMTSLLIGVMHCSTTVLALL